MKMTETAVIVPFVTVGSDDKVMPPAASDVPPGVYRAAWGEMTPPARRTEASEAPTRRMRRPTMRVMVPAGLVDAYNAGRALRASGRARSGRAGSVDAPRAPEAPLAMVATVAGLFGAVAGTLVAVALLL